MLWMEHSTVFWHGWAASGVKVSVRGRAVRVIGHAKAPVSVNIGKDDEPSSNNYDEDGRADRPPVVHQQWTATLTAPLKPP